MSDARDRLERLLGGAALAGLRARLRRRYELDRTQDAFILSRLSPDERRALEGLLGRRARSAGSMQLSLADLDQALARAGGTHGNKGYDAAMTALEMAGLLHAIQRG